MGMVLAPQETQKEPIIQEVVRYESVFEHEKAVINVVEQSSPAVVSVVASKDVPYIISPFGDFFAPREERYRTERRDIAEGTGFLVASNGLILTNKHVVKDEEADYTVFFSDGKEFDARVLVRDPVQDLAVLQIEGEDFPTLPLGDSDSIRPGQTAIAIGNALGEFQDTVSVGVISGLGRRVSATDGRMVEILEDVIQTDAAINRGNSGGPLLNLKGEVIGVNTAMAAYAQNIGFAIPVNRTQRAIEAAKTGKEVAYPFLGVHYVLVDQRLKERENLPVDYGALLVSGDRGEPAVFPDSAADRAGLREGDIILQFDEQKISRDNSLARVIIDYYPEDEVELKIMRDNREITAKAVLKTR